MNILLVTDSYPPEICSTSYNLNRIRRSDAYLYLLTVMLIFAVS